MFDFGLKITPISRIRTMSNTCNVIALIPRPTALRTRAPKTFYPAPLIRMTATFRALIDEAASPGELALLRLALSDVTNGGFIGFVTWSVDEICRTLVIRQWPSCRVLDIVPFPVTKLSPRGLDLRLAGRISVETAIIGIADDPDPAMNDETGRRIGSRVGSFPCSGAFRGDFRSDQPFAVSFAPRLPRLALARERDDA
jgi:hypothetical protein